MAPFQEFKKRSDPTIKKEVLSVNGNVLLSYVEGTKKIQKISLPGQR